MIKIRAFKIDFISGSYDKEEWFNLSLESFIDDAPSENINEYDYIQIIPLSSYKRYFFSNDGAQAFRHRKTGWTIPDYCRQLNGCPEIWTKSKKRNLVISIDSPVWDYIVYH